MLFHGRKSAQHIGWSRRTAAIETHEDALAQQTISDLARKAGRKAPTDFSGRGDNWINERREKKSRTSVPLSDDQIIPVIEVTEATE